MKNIQSFSIFLTAIVFLSLMNNCQGEKDRNLVVESPTKTTIVDDTLTLVFGGDIMGHTPQQEAAYSPQTGSYDFKPCYQFIKPYIASADFAMANLETPLAGKPYTGYPYFSSPDELLDGALSAGFDALQLANNHAADKGKKGIKKTFYSVNKKMLSVGVYLNKNQRDSIYPLIVNIKGLKIAFLNGSYDTNGNPVAEPIIVNLIDTLQIREDVESAHRKGAKYIILTLHWGTEYKLRANKQQRELAHFFAKIGVDAIIGSHPHVVQNFEWISKNDNDSIPVFYSLGNVISNQRWKNSNGGILAKIQISKSTRNLISVSYLPFYVHKGTIDGKFQYYLIPTKKYQNNGYEFKLPEKEENELAVFDKLTRKRLANIESWE